MRDVQDEIRKRGAELVIVGNGAAHFAQAFREDFALDGPILVDPELRAYRAAGLRRGRVEVLSPRMGLNAARALRKGFRQEGVQGDPWQLGGVFVLRAGGELTYRYASREAGDHPPVEAILAALDPDAEPVEEEPRAGLVAAGLGRLFSALVDPTVVLSFDKTGFRIHALTFDPADLQVDLSNRRMVVTGANSGIGFETALGLADLGAEVVMLCRNAGRGEEAAHAIRERSGNRRVTLEVCDLSSLRSVREVGARLAETPLDVLVHNAGLLPDERVETEDGLELTWALHVAGPHLLTALLRPALERSDDARVIWVSSGGMYTRKLQLEDPDWTARDYDGTLAYAETKRAQVVLAELWAEHLRDRGVVVNSMHPGWADTPGVERSLPAFRRITQAILRTPAEGADTVLWLAASAAGRAHTGRFFFDRRPRRTHLLPGTRESASERRALWERVETLTARRSPGPSAEPDEPEA